MSASDGLRKALPLKFIKTGGEAEGEKIAKVSVGYIHRRGSDYRCKGCVMFIPDIERCLIHGEDQIIRAIGYCVYWAKGKPFPGLKPMGSVSKLESGYGEDPNGTTCAKCEYFLEATSDCQKVDRNSPGDDPGRIDPGACCGNQDPKD